MRAIEHPVLGPVVWLPADQQPPKVWKHFYAPNEAWQALVVVDPSQLRRRAEGDLGVTWPAAGAKLRESTKARRLLSRDHDEFYGPAYLQELGRPDTVIAPALDEHQRRKALTRNSVLLVVHMPGAVAHVVTAFRPHPPTSIVLDEVDRRHYAVDYFARTTGMQIAGDPDQVRHMTTPRTIEQLLMWALGPARTADADQVDTMRRSLPAGLAAQLLDSFDFRAAEDAVVDALRSDDSAEFEKALLDAEDLLNISTALGRQDMAEAFLTRLAPVIAWTPSEWSAIGSLAERRLMSYADRPDAPAAPFWNSVLAAQVGDAIRAAAPVRRRASWIVDELFPERTIWDTADELIAGLGQAPAAAAKWVMDTLSGLSVQQPAVVMSAQRLSDVWQLQGLGAPPNVHVRAFVVDKETPEVHDVTENWIRRTVSWQFEQPGQVALLVLVLSDQQIPQGPLPSLVEAAREGRPIYICAKVITRPT